MQDSTREKIIKYCNEKNIEAYLILMDFKKAYNMIDRETVEFTMRAMNFVDNLIEMVKLLILTSRSSDSKERHQGKNI